MQIPSNQIVGKLSWWARRIANVLARSSLAEVLLISTLVLSHYYLNIDFSYPSEIIIPIVLLGLIVSVLFYLLRLIHRNVFAAHLAALPLAYGLYGYQYLAPRFVSGARWLLPHTLETTFTVSAIAVLLMMVICGLVSWGAAWLLRRKWFLPLQLPKVLIFFVAFVFVSEATKVGLKLFQFRHELAYQYKVTMPAKSTTTATKPDIYYIVLDRYASATTLKNDYNFDNSQFTSYLSSQGFVNRDPAYANYPFTMSSITSTLAMDYHTQLGSLFGGDTYQTAFPYRRIFNDPPAAQILKQDGYSYNQVSSWWDFTRVGIQADTHPTISYRLNIFGAHFYLSDLSRDIVNKSILSPWLKKGITFGHTPIITYDLDDNPYQNFEKQMTALKNISGTSHTTPQFTFAHILSPHDPYIFDSDGSTPTYDGGRNDSGVDETVKYTNQLTYLNKRIEDTIATMRRQSPNAVIIIQSDEGPYPKDFRFALTPQHYYDPINLSVPSMQQKFGVLASYYMPGVDQQTTANTIVSSVDSLRFVLAHYLGYNLPMLPDCQFATGDKYKVYTYQQVTDKLTGTPTPSACTKYQ